MWRGSFGGAGGEAPAEAQTFEEHTHATLPAPAGRALPGGARPARGTAPIKS